MTELVYDKEQTEMFIKFFETIKSMGNIERVYTDNGGGGCDGESFGFGAEGKFVIEFSNGAIKIRCSEWLDVDIIKGEGKENE